MPEPTTYETGAGWCDWCGVRRLDHWGQCPDWDDGRHPLDESPAVDPPGDFGFDRRAYVRGEVGR